jgi:endonuclease III related protein
MTPVLMEFYHMLRAHFGHRNWWPAKSQFEVCVGAVLTQNTAWKNVAKAIENLETASALDALTIYDLPPAKLAELIRPAGYYNVKAGRLRNFVKHLVEKHGGELNSLFALPLDQLRAELLSINGVGKETADSMILYAARKPIFVVDAYTKRVLVQHSLVSEDADYNSIQELFQDNLPIDEALFNDFHAQFVAVGHHYCKKRPLCDKCPLQTFLPA